MRLKKKWGKAVLAGTALLTALSGLSLSAFAEGAKRHVEILRDTYGVPHVYANDRFGLYYGYGFALGQDRLFEMEMAKRTFSGRVSEVLGDSFLEHDKAVRATYWEPSLQKQYDALSKEDKAILDGYAAGMNAWIEKVKAQPNKLMPKQFIDFGFEPEEWTAMDVIKIYYGSMVVQFSDRTTEIENLAMLQALQAKHGKDKGMQIFNQLNFIHDSKAPTVISGDEFDWNKKTESLKAAALPSLDTLSATAASLQQASVNTNELLPTTAFRSMSNMMIVGKKKAENANAIIVNGPQFVHTNPSYVYSVGLHGAGFNVVGNAPMAAPIILFGHNDKIGWGATAGFGDTVDTFEEKLNPANPTQYEYNGKYVPMETYTETIAVKGKEPVSMEMSRTVHGIVMQTDKEKNIAYSRKRSWDGYELDSLFGWIGTTQASNYDEWSKQAERMAISISMYYGDKEGNIAYYFAGKQPQRNEQQDVRLPTPGTGSMDWKGVYPANANPQVLNPKQGYIVNWNNSPAKNYPSPDMYSFSWGAADRVHVLDSLITEKQKLSPDDMWDLIRKSSYVDVNAKFFLPYLKEATKGLPGHDELAKAAKLVEKWNTQSNDANKDNKYDSPGSLIMETWLTNMITRTLADDLPSEYFELFKSPGYPNAKAYSVNSTNIQQGTKVVYNALLGEKAGVPQTYDFFNGKAASQVVREALEDTVKQLKEAYGPDMNQWLKPVVPITFQDKNYKGIPQANPDEKVYNHQAMNRGTENNLIVFTKTGEIIGYEVTAPGQSGFVAPDGTKNKHYDDQLGMYEDFGKKRTWLTREEVEKHLESKEVLQY
ncbi:penicillin acylase family protein [Brevibacillus ruminantium]|uniref:Penicillin acylase family protein n=1 Tax=Brevibacillus ruminantium TaxID=2950604 RepID=A0ABY4WLY5_9BACL|nr:penicillin acylase family protein [Brevibacillus ruminantium]USG66865.1 penicillin acylase family protein [Brevibacillus ruminantium]